MTHAFFRRSHTWPDFTPGNVVLVRASGFYDIEKRYEDLTPERQSYLRHKAATAGTPIPSVVTETRVAEEDMADVDDGPSR